MQPFKSHAPALAAAGWAVFPVAPRGKAPLAGSHGHLDASSDPLVVQEWARKHPECNIGLRPPESYVVLDLDHVAPFRAWLEENQLELPLTRTVRSGRGWHYYCRLPESLQGEPLRAKLPGLDLKTSRSFVLAPGSVASSGRIYKVVRDLPVATLGEEWTQHLRRPEKLRANTDPNRHQGASPAALTAVEVTREGQALIRHFRLQKPGSGRRNYLQGCLFGVHQRLGGDPATIESLVRVAVDHHGKSESDVRRLAAWVANQAGATA